MILRVEMGRIYPDTQFSSVSLISDQLTELLLGPGPALLGLSPLL